MKKVALLFTLVLLSFDLNAYTAKSDVEIKNIRVRPSVAYVKFSGCNSYSKIYLTNEYYKAMLSVALTAAAANKKVSVEFQGKQSCANTEPLINYIDVAI
ncbi:hypothetical protein [Pseudoalteromonas phenolica]|uniref:hypothetical protein n=1 Tax=Pseudoalteromonas phenolica TaxID=161398 RepID=UPI003850E78B